jgi:CBS domain-containing protein
MKVANVMTLDPAYTSPDATLAVAAALMRQADCGFLPVVSGGRLRGVVTDRDLLMKLAWRDEPASSFTVSEVMTHAVVTCTPFDKVAAVLETMRTYGVRRLPVTGFGRRLLGVISLTDIARFAGHRSVRRGDVVATLRSIGERRQPGPGVAAA